ncbi:MAG: 4Fe-4S dicluster domain-containing protein [Saprospiraceae bacterium]
MAEIDKYNYKKGSTDSDFFRDSIATVDAQGKRNWIYPKQQKGKFFKYRTYLSYVLLAFLFVAPWIRIGGQPLLLLNVIKRKFVIFGITFWPQDFHLFVLAMMTGIVFIVLFTVIFGRLFCGWICPQTIFMEGVFRKIEYWIEGTASQQQRLSKLPWSNQEKIKKRGSKLVLFYIISFLIGNTFLMYIIGTEDWLSIITEPPSSNWGGFIGMIIFSFVFYFVFANLREQVCTSICPYGRLQGVMLDKKSIVVAYDYVRGEPRGRGKKRQKVVKKTTPNPLDIIQSAVSDAADSSAIKSPESQEEVIKLGDCIDCGLCVKVCPTGIDIRNGTQLECINCTLCIDACDEIMTKVKKPTGLIRYASALNIEKGEQFSFTPRIKAYSAVLVVLLGVLFVSLTSRSDVEATVLRTAGTLSYEVDSVTVSNLYNIQIANKTTKEMPITLKIADEAGVVKMVGKKSLVVPSQGIAKGGFFIELKKSTIKDRKTKLKIEVYSGDKKISTEKTNFLYQGKRN